MEENRKKVIVIGGGKSGICSANLLLDKGYCVTLFDGNKDLKKDDMIKKIGRSDLEFSFGTLPINLEEFNLCVVSPGVPLDIKELKQIREYNIPIWGEIELASRYCRGDILAITGTNGKTTTTSLLYEILRRAGKNAFALGNIGTPFTKGASKTKAGDVVAAEISSFQLETAITFHPKVSAILNITPDHLNRHKTMEEYVKVKESITKNQGEGDTVILNYDSDLLREFGAKISKEVKVLYFSSEHELKNGMYYKDGIIYLEKKEVLRESDLQILGVHNMENVMAAFLIAYEYNIDIDVIKSACKTFSGVEHRIEFVTEKDKVSYYNDSKGTNPDAAIKAIKAMKGSTLLIGGGYDKGNDYRDWIMAFDGKVRKFILIGETKEKIKEEAIKNNFNKEDIILFDSFSDAVNYAKKEARAGENVLLSPACASWGMFNNYEERGCTFKKLVIENEK